MRLYALKILVYPHQEDAKTTMNVHLTNIVIYRLNYASRNQADAIQMQIVNTEFVTSKQRHADSKTI